MPFSSPPITPKAVATFFSTLPKAEISASWVYASPPLSENNVRMIMAKLCFFSRTGDNADRFIGEFIQGQRILVRSECQIALNGENRLGKGQKYLP